MSGNGGDSMNRQARRAAGKKRRDRAAAPERTGAPQDAARTCHHLAQTLMSGARYDDALQAFVRAIELDPRLWDAHHGLCRSLIALGRYADAAAHYEALTGVHPDAATYESLAIALLGAGQPERALRAVCQALAVAETGERRALFVACVQKVAALPDVPGLRALMLRALCEPWGRPAKLAAQGARLVATDPAIARLIADIGAGWPRRPAAGDLLSAPGFSALAGDPLLRAVLENAPIVDIALERLLTAARAALLEGATIEGGETAPDVLAFFAALARQCFVNEYVFEVQDGESRAVDRLRIACIAALQAGAPVPARCLLALAAYVPLHDLGSNAALLTRAWPPPVEDVLTQQLREPARERELRAAMPVLTPIDDTVSIAVQSQYEENPYPRWVKTAPAGQAVPLNARLRHQFPLSGFRPLPQDRNPDVLVAGCGTGQQLADVAQRIAGARVLAIDLSLASLAYARRKTEDMGASNIAYAQADILKLGAIDRRFDVIDCGGVLHHLGDPLAGWRVLLSLLKPDGVMRIALYSALARRHVVAARALVAERGHASSAAGIRRFRQDILALPDDAPAKAVTQSADFFALSALRDLVFHVQEHRFTLPQIGAFLDAERLRFLGFEIDQRAQAHYAARFPQDRARTDLACWHRFEEDNPWTFGGMYQFWVQKPAH